MLKLVLLFALFFTIAHSQTILGASPETIIKFTKNKENFQCFDGSKSIPFDRVNDDYCDCEDGSDEPGTSACSHVEESKFYCKNVGFYPKFIHSSVVNDGRCDCCDGSDENDGKIQCPNTCIAAGESIRKELTEKIVQFQTALVKKEEYTQQGSQSLEEKSKRLREVEVEFNKEEAILKDLESKKNQLEQVEKAERAVNADEEIKQHQEEAKNFEQQKGELLGEEKKDDSGNPFVKFINEEEKKEEKATEQKEKEEEKKTQEEPKPPVVNHEPNQGLFTTLVKSITQFYHKAVLFYHSYNFNRTEAEEARKKHAEQQTKVEPLRTEYELLKKEVGFSTGHSAFFVLKDKCFNVVDKQYTYEVCLFSNSHQKSKDGTSTHLGNWEAWDDTKKIMKYTNGQSCWNGPNRSAHVTVKCGATEELKNVDEPSMCVYTMDFETPAACNEEDLEKLKKELSLLNGE